jgi:large subunit ribosomal protein L15
MLTLKNLKSPKGANRDTKRIGRGQGSGQGQEAGKGHKGQKSRKSGHVRPGFEGGNMPLYKRLPKRGFSNHTFKVTYASINIGQLETIFKGAKVTREELVNQGLLKGINKTLPIKILSKGTLTRALTFTGIEKFSKAAEETIKKIGGKIDK